MSEALRLLLVEDNEHDAELLALELSRAGFRLDCTRVETQDTFLDALDEGRWDLVISDVELRRFDGQRAFALFHRRGLDVPFIFVSGVLGEERAVSAMRAGVRDYVLKDNLALLPIAVRRELEAAAVRRRHRRAHATAQIEQRRLATAVEASGAGIFEHEISPGGDLWVSDRCAAILGLAPADVPTGEASTEWLLRRVHDEDLPALQDGYRRIVEHGEPRLAAQARLAHKDGSWIHATISAKPLHDEAGRVTRVVGVVIDDSPRRQLEQQLRQAQKMEAIGQLAGGVAHDFNNLLTAIFGFAQFALRKLEPGHAAREHIEHVLHASQRAERLTSQLLAFSRRKVVRPRPVALDAVVRELEPMLRTLLGEDIEMRLQLPAALRTTRIDPSAFEQVLVNLCVNARDAMPRGGCLTIETYDVDLDETYGPAHGAWVPPGDYVVTAVTDTGMGMSLDVQQHIFEPFFTTKGGKGTGLGLSTCYGIIKQAEGYLWVYSEPGSGTTFKVYLPCCEEPAVARRVETPPASLQGSETVLVTEDDEQVRSLLCAVLISQGYDVLEARDGEEALRLAAATDATIHLLVTDVIMPGMNGPQLAHRIRHERPELRVLFVSGYTKNAMADRGLLEPDRRVLQKPFAPADLLREVRLVLDATS